MSTAAATVDIEDYSTPTASINSLPVEIKALIINLAKLQDESYYERQELECQEVYELTRGVLAENRWRGKSLNALFEVNKEWSDLAAVHIFESITSKHDITSPIFKFVVHPRRVSLLQSIDLDGSNHADRLRLLLLSPMVYGINFDGGTVKALFGNLVNPGISGTIEQNLHWFAFCARGRSITKLEMILSLLSEVICILGALPALTEIDLGITGQKTDKENLKLGVLLSQYSSLKELNIYFDDGSIPASWIDLEWKSASSLRSLSLTASITSDAFQTDLDFIGSFGSSLERLVLNFYRSADSPTLTSSVTFPKLAFLDITCTNKDLPHLLKVFFGSPIVSLRYETVHRMNSARRVVIDRTLTKYISDHPSFRKLEYVNRFLQPHALPEVEMLSASRRIVIKYSVWSFQNVADPDPAWILSDQEHFNYRQPILKKVFNHGNDLLGKLEKENDVEGLKEMFDNCKWLRASLAESED